MSLPNFVLKSIAFARNVATDVKQLRGWIGLLSYLTTTNKTSLVEAVNEVNGKVFSTPYHRRYTVITPSFNTQGVARIKIARQFAGMIKIHLTGGYSSANVNGYIELSGGIGVNANGSFWNNQLNCVTSIGQTRACFYIDKVAKKDPVDDMVYFEVHKKLAANNNFTVEIELLSVVPFHSSLNPVYDSFDSSVTFSTLTNEVEVWGLAGPGTDKIVTVDTNGKLIRSANALSDFALATSIPTGQLTVNTTSDLVGGYVYLPSGNLTTTLGLAAHVLNAIVDGQTAFSYGNHANAGYMKTSGGSNTPLDTIFTGGGRFILGNNGVITTHGLLIPHGVGASNYGTMFTFRNGRAWFKTKENGVLLPLREFWHDGNFNPSNYATTNEINNIYDQLNAKANTRLSNVVSDLSNAEKTTIKFKLGISEIESPYKAENENIKTIGNGWQTYVGGRFNQALGDKITIKGNNLNYIGFNLVGSGALHAVLGNYNVSNGVLNNIVGNYNSANSNLINLIGNYLYSKQEGQSVYGNYNKLEDAEIEPEKKKIHVFASGKSEYERDNAVEIFADNSTKLRGRGYYDAETRQEEWFSQENTLADIKFLKTSGIVDDIPNLPNGTLTQLAASGIFVGARNTVGTSSTQFFALATNSAFNCFATHGILRGSTVRYKGQIGPAEFTPAEHNYLANILEVPKNQYLIAEYKTDLGFVALRLLDGVGLLSIKNSSTVGILIGYFISVGGGQFGFEFKHQIL